MSVETYFACAMVMAVIFGAASDLEQGDYKRAGVMLFCCAVWPVSITFGTGLMIGGAYRWIRRFVRGVMA